MCTFSAYSYILVNMLIIVMLNCLVGLNVAKITCANIVELKMNSLIKLNF